MTSTSGKRGALIFLHGLGDSPAGWSSLAQALPKIKPRLADIEYVFPPAPTIPISINGGMTMPGWFDLMDWPIAVGCQDDREGLLQGVAAVQAEVQKLNEAGIPTSKIVVGGFSQGGAVAVLSAYHKDSGASFAGCVGLSAWVTLASEIAHPAPTCPLFWGHGRFDDKVLFEQQKFGVDLLRKAGVTVIDRQYDMGHSSHPEEMQETAEFIDRLIFGGDNDNDSGAKSEL